MPVLQLINSISITLLSITLCAGYATAQFTEENQPDTPQHDQEYRFLVYKQVTQANPGLRSQVVKQRLPIGPAGRAGNQAVVGGIATPEPIGDPGMFQAYSKQIVEPYRLSRNKSIVVESNQVLLRDKVTAEQAVLAKGPQVADLMFASTLARTAMSPSGNRIVTAILTSAEGEGIRRSPRYEINVVDLFAPIVVFPKSTKQLLSSSQHEPKFIRKNVPGETADGSGVFPHAVAPALLWLDDQTVLLMAPYDGDENHPADDDRPNEVQVIRLNNDGSKPRVYELIAINVATTTAKTICRLEVDLPAFHPELFPVLWRRCDGAIMLRNHAVDHRIDLEKGGMVEDRRLAPQYELKGDRYLPSLWFGNEQLCESLYFRHAAVSPDGRCIAWYARSVHVFNKTNPGNTSQHLTTLWFHSPATGTVELAEGNFDSSQPFLKLDNPGYSELFEWLTDD